MLDTKKTQKLKAFVIIILLAATLIGAGAYGFFYSNGGSSSLSSTSGKSEYINAKNRVNALTQQLKSRPQ